MGEQTSTYEYGTFVWTKLVINMWWPGTVVDPKTVPDDLKEFIERKKNIIAIVLFKADNVYEVVINKNKICLYSCNNKMEHLEKGYSKYLKWKDGSKATRNFSMQFFIDEVISIEKEIGGDINIFDQFADKFKKSCYKLDLSISELFSTAKQRKKKSVGRKLSLPPTLSTPVAKQKPQIPKTVAKPVCSPAISSSVSSSSERIFKCHLSKDCCFTSKGYDLLKFHMKGDHKVVKDNTNKKSPKTKKRALSNSSSNNKLQPKEKKRKYTKTKKTESKKVKLQEEILKDWSDDEDFDNIDDNDDDDDDDDRTIAEIEREVTLSNVERNANIFDFDFDDENSQQNVENESVDNTCNESVKNNYQSSDVDNDSSEDLVIPNDHNIIGCKLLPPKNDEKTKKDDTEQSNDSILNIENSKLLLENTESTLDQINDFEKSLTNVNMSPKNELANESCPTTDDTVENEPDTVSSSTIKQNSIEEKFDPTENGRYECFMSQLPTPGWAKDPSWTNSPQNGLKEAMLFSRINTEMQILNIDDLKPEPSPEVPFTPRFIAEVNPKYEDNSEDKEIIDSYTLRVPLKKPTYTMEQLQKLPVVQDILDTLKEDPEGVNVVLTPIEGMVIRDKKPETN